MDDEDLEHEDDALSMRGRLARCQERAQEWWRREIWPVSHITLSSGTGFPGGRPGVETLEVLPRSGAKRILALGYGCGVATVLAVLELAHLLMR